MRLALRGGFAVAAVVGAAAAAWALLPGRVHVARATVIAAPQATVFELLNDPSTMRRWSPWRAPGARFLFSGPRVGPGARVDWTGRDPGGEAIARSHPYDAVDYRMEFRGLPAAEQFRLTPARGGVRVEWRLQRSAGWDPVRRAQLFLFRSQAGVDLEHGLDRLGEVAEALPRADLATARVRLVQRPEGWAVEAVSPGDLLDPALAAARLYMGLHRLAPAGPARVEARGDALTIVTPVRAAGA